MSFNFILKFLYNYKSLFNNFDFSEVLPNNGVGLAGVRFR